MIIRGIDANGDWLFGKGGQDYVSGNLAVAQLIQSNILMFLNDCFFAMDQGIDWFNLLGNKNQTAISLAVNAAIINTTNVTSLVQSSINLARTARSLSIAYQVTTVYTGTSAPMVGSLSYLVTESGDFLNDESGDRILI